MGQPSNHNYSIETQFEVVTRAGRLPNTLLHKTPGQFNAADEYELSKIFDTLLNEPQFKVWLRKSVDTIDDRVETKREREEDPDQPSLFDRVVDVAEGVAVGVAIGGLLGGDSDDGDNGGGSGDSSSPDWGGDGGAFEGAGASGDFGGSGE